MTIHDTIFALSSGLPPAAIAVVRVSGPQTSHVVEKIAGSLPVPRHAALRVLRARDGHVLDQALVLWFPGPKSETGEDVAEFQVHGGRAVVSALLDTLSQCAGCRLAEPGEFTRRAFENGQLDLTAVEGLADLVSAETDAQRRQALGQLAGGLRGRAETWRARLIEALALAEAAIDFSDEGDVPDGLVAQARGIAGALASDIGHVVDSAGQGEAVREGIRVAIAGPPNAGKSTLFNYLAGRDAAIVSPYPGTTRDVLEVRLDLGGYLVILSDTAGLRDAADPVEDEGIRRARKNAAAANLVLWVQEAGTIPDGLDQSGWTIFSKADLSANVEARSGGQNSYAVSAKTGAGMGGLIAALAAFAKTAGGAEPALVTRLRQRELLVQAQESLVRAQSESAEEMVAEELRTATAALGRLLGRVDVEDVLDRIFGEFCIGK